MKKLFLLGLAACFSVLASAQKVYFLYLQSEDQSPFYVKMGAKIHSSATAGFIILPNLTDSTYTFGLGFAKSSDPESRFTITINQNDKGYIIKNMQDGLALFDFQDLSLVKSVTAQKDNTVYETKNDNFSSILSKAASDPSLLKVPVAKKEEITKEQPKEKEVLTAKLEESKTPEVTTEAATTAVEIRKEQPKETIVKETKPVADSAVITETFTEATSAALPVAQSQSDVKNNAQEIAFKPSIISRYSESSTTEGFGLIYFDKQQESIDTIRILIPASKVKLVADTETAANTEEGSLITKNESSKEELKTVAIADKETTEPVKSNKSLTSCKNLASEKDFLKLRKKMAAKDHEDGMLDEARREFRSKCYSVEQVRYLSTLFLTSASKYQFFDAAYEHVSDINNFASLGTEIKDDHYTKRFKALIGE